MPTLSNQRSWHATRNRSCSKPFTLLKNMGSLGEMIICNCTGWWIQRHTRTHHVNCKVLKRCVEIYVAKKQQSGQSDLCMVTDLTWTPQYDHKIKRNTIKSRMSCSLELQNLFFLCKAYIIKQKRNAFIAN